MIKLTLIIACVLGATMTAYAQVAVPPFTSSIQEKFDALPAGSHTSFVGFSGLAATFANLGTGGAMIINNSGTILPPVSPKHDLFGRGVDVRIDFHQKVAKQFGGMFRVAKAGVNPTQAKLQFFRAGMPVGVAVVVPVNPAAWKWHGYDLSKVGGYDEVHITSLGGTLPGYVGMDNLVRR
jgi:hypothetical protein